MSQSTRSVSPDAGQTATTSRVVTIARTEIKRTVRSRSLQVLMVLMLTATVLIFRTAGTGSGFSDQEVVGLIGLPFQLIVPIAAILTGAFSISGDRESGTLRLLLGLPSSRTEVVLGKFLGVGTVITVGIASTTAVAALASHITIGSGQTATLLGIAGATILLGWGFLGFAIGVSAVVPTQKRATAITTGGYLTLLFLWEVVVAGAHYAVTQRLPEPPLPGWVSALELGNPIIAYARAAEAFGVSTVAPLRVTFGLITRSDTSSAAQAGAVLPTQPPDFVAIVVLGLWIAVPVAIGTLRFRQADI